VAMEEKMISSLDRLEYVEKLCYLGDLICAGGRAEKASRARVRCNWKILSNNNVQVVLILQCVSYMK